MITDCGLWSRLYTGSLCDNGAAETAIVTLYK